jgi:hypothetical protein
MTCHLSDHKSSPSVKVMDRPTEAVEVAAKAVGEEDVEDVADVAVEEDVARKRNENWRSSKWRMSHSAGNWQPCSLLEVQAHLAMRRLSLQLPHPHQPTQEMLLGDVTPCRDVLDPTTDVFGDFVID